jgi:hypothetical protein
MLPPVFAAFVIYAGWVVATYLLEALPGTLLRPEAVALRLAYALIANLALGIVVPLWLVRRFVREGGAAPEDFGFSAAGRTAVSMFAAAVVGYGLFAFSRSGPTHPIVLLNTFAQVWVGSLAEIVICWGLIGALIYLALRSWHRGGAYVVASAVASIAFGVYHFAHSAPFNELRMVLFLTGIGLVTSLWWFVSRDVYGTAILHNFFGVTGVLGALTAGGQVPEKPQFGISLITTAMVVSFAFAMLGSRWLRRHASQALQSQPPT